MLDRRRNYETVKKFKGNKGSVRAMEVISVEGQEYVVCAGCDRHVRIFDPQCES